MLFLKAKLYRRLRTEISNHTQGEEKVLYSRLRQIERTQSLAIQSEEEHAVIEHLLSQLDRTSPADPRWEVLCAMLEEDVKGHVKEEETRMFPKMERVFTHVELAELCDEFEDAKFGLLTPLSRLVG